MKSYIAFHEASSIRKINNRRKRRNKLLSRIRMNSWKVRRLKDLGLLNIKSNEIAKKGIPSFQRLPALGAYIFVSIPNSMTLPISNILGRGYALEESESLFSELILNPPLLETKILKHIVRNKWPECTGVDLAHERNIKGNDITIILLDTGCSQCDEFENNQKIFVDNCLDENPSEEMHDRIGHGTSIAGVVASNTFGIAPNVNLVVAKITSGKERNTTPASLYASMNLALEEAIKLNRHSTFILNCAYGVENGDDKMSMFSEFDRLANENLFLTQSLTIASIGNVKYGESMVPAACPNIFSVGAIDLNMKLLDESGGNIDNPQAVGLSGLNSFSIDNSHHINYICNMKGTSISAAYVTGIAALYAQSTNKKGRELWDILVNTALGADELNLSENENLKVGAGLVRFQVL